MGIILKSQEHLSCVIHAVGYHIYVRSCNEKICSIYIIERGIICFLQLMLDFLNTPSFRYIYGNNRLTKGIKRETMNNSNKGVFLGVVPYATGFVVNLSRVQLNLISGRGRVLLRSERNNNCKQNLHNDKDISDFSFN